MVAQIDQLKAQTDLARSQARWEYLKAISAFAVGVAAVAGIILGVAHLIH